MTAPSYVGPTVTAQCPSCGHVAEVPDWESPSWEDGLTGNCERCERMVNWEPWRGPVMTCA